MSRTVFFLLVFFSFVVLRTGAQVKQEIFPMLSNCGDVEKLLKVSTCKTSHEFYIFETESVSIDYSSGKCETAFGKKWAVPIGTVLNFTRIFKTPRSLMDFAVDIGKCKKNPLISDIKDEVVYSCEDVGMEIYVTKDLISSITYIPTPKDNCLICK